LQQIKEKGSDEKTTREPYGNPRVASQFSKERVITATFQPNALKKFEKTESKGDVNYNII